MDVSLLGRAALAHRSPRTSLAGTGDVGDRPQQTRPGEEGLEERPPLCKESFASAGGGGRGPVPRRPSCPRAGPLAPAAQPEGLFWEWGGHCRGADGPVWFLAGVRGCPHKKPRRHNEPHELGVRHSREEGGKRGPPRGLGFRCTGHWGRSREPWSCPWWGGGHLKDRMTGGPWACPESGRTWAVADGEGGAARPGAREVPRLRQPGRGDAPWDACLPLGVEAGRRPPSWLCGAQRALHAWPRGCPSAHLSVPGSLRTGTWQAFGRKSAVTQEEGGAPFCAG